MYLKNAAAKINIILNPQIIFIKIIHELQMFFRDNLDSFKIKLYHTSTAG